MTKLTRKRDSQFRLPAIFLTFFLLTNPTAAYGSCLAPNVTEGFERAKAVFVGEVTEITPPRSTDKDATFFERAYLVEFKIEKSWKGLPFGSLKVWALQGNESFALPAFNKGERYVVYADAVHSDEASTHLELMVSECNRTALLPKDPKPRPKIMRDVVDRRDGTEDLRALDSLLILKGR